MAKEMHELYLSQVYPSGAEEWYCPTCGRRLIVEWREGFESTVIINYGNKDAVHTGTRHKDPPNTVESEPSTPTVEPAPPTPADIPELIPFQEWLDNFLSKKRGDP